MRGRARTYVRVTAAVAIGLLASACSSHPQTPAQASASASASASAHAAQVASELKITPANGSRGVSPSAAITVTATKGKVTNVTVASRTGPVSGTLSAGGKSWHSTWTLAVSQTYTVTAARLVRGWLKISMIGMPTP